MPSFISIPVFLSMLFGLWGNFPTALNPIKVEMVTTQGTIVLKLYDETPNHRDNFLKLVKEGVYDSLLFHRVIKDFMIQAGDIQSKNADSLARLGSSDLPYQVPSEIRPEYFHKKGALAAARTNNPQRASSSTQFYLVQGKIQNDSLLAYHENRINQFLSRHYAINDHANSTLMDSLNLARSSKDSVAIGTLSKKVEDRVTGYTNFERYRIPEAHRLVYKTIGGTPHLDQNYTVFGEIIEGLDVVDRIAAQETGKQDRPRSNVRILRVRVITEN
jgi:cyclophilin family peptidyl-prolyl cis-trans isomerase